ncbi:MAG: hypothetical protein AB1Z98_14850 [Nannocystaceae bacterium]
MPAIGQELLNVPFPQMVRNMGLAIAEAQYELDVVSMRLAQMMAGYVESYDDEGNLQTETRLVTFGGTDYSLLELGFTPTFYQFVDTIIEVKISITIGSEASYQRRQSSFSAGVGVGFFLGFGGASLRTTSVSASFASKYQYSAEGSSLLRTKLVPVPAPAVLEERIRQLFDAQNPPPA